MKQIEISATAIDAQLFKCEMETFKYQDAMEKRENINALSALNWYISTGRASSAWIRAFLSGNPAVMMRRAGRYGTDTEKIAAITRYLQRYCGLENPSA